MITTSAWRNAHGAAVGGVGIVLSQQAEKSLAEVKAINQRILVATFSGSPNTTVIANYAPCEGSENSEAHYQKLTEVANSIPKHHFLIECGDFNAHIGEKDAPYTFHQQTNSNGSLLLDHATECNFLITNTQRQKRKGKLWTYLSDMNGCKTQIDFILVNRKWRNSVHNVEAYNSFSSLGGDHRLVTATIHLSLRKSKAAPKKIQYVWTSLKNTELQQKYTLTVRNRFTALQNEDDDATATYDKFIQANTEVTEEMIPKKKKMKGNSTSKHPQIVAAREEVQETFANYQRNPSRNREKLWKDSKQKLQKTYKEIEEEELDEMIRQVEEANEKSKHGESWKLINKITGRKEGKQGIVKGKSKEERIQKWYTHFKDLLGKDPVRTEAEEDEIDPVLQGLLIEDGNFTIEELEKAKKSLKDGKQAGPDNIPPEILKNCDFNDIILELANNLLNHLDKPRQWSEINLVPVPKSGDLSDTSNYRGISLAPIVAKLVNKMVLNRIQPRIDNHLRPNQNGFRPGRTTTAHILALRRLIEGVRNHNQKALVLYVDFKKAFDSIHRSSMMRILKAYDIPPKLLAVVEKMYEGTRAKVITPDGETDFFQIKAGVLQGDTLAPYLFAIVLDHVLRNTFAGKEKDLGFQLQRQRSRRVPAVIVTDLDFADDLALLTEEIEQAQEVLYRLEKEAEKVGLYCNAKKTEVQAFNQDGPVNIKAKNGETLKVVENFKYLGAWTESSSTDIAVRKALAWSACHRLRKVWSSKLRRQIKERLFLATVDSVLLYGAETWTLTNTMEKQLNGCYTRMLRMAFNVSYKDHLTNVELYGDLPQVTSKIQQRRLRLAGHCIRHPEEIANKLDGTRNRGPQKTTYVDNLLRDTGIENSLELRYLMEDRVEWKKVVTSLGRSNGRLR